MKNKKAEAQTSTIILVSLLVIVLLGGFVMMLILINQNVSEEKELQKTISVYIQNINNKTKFQLDGKYYLLNNQTLISEGNLDSTSLIEIKEIKSLGVTAFCKTEGYYSSIKEKNFTQLEIENNASKVTCNSNAYGDLIIESNSNIQDEEGRIVLTLSSKRQFKNISGVISWKSGTIWVKYKDQTTNYIPYRFRGLTDYSFDTNISLDNSNQTIILDYKAINQQRQTDDCITITFYDQDLYYENEIKQSSEYKGENLGNPKDFSKTICYEL